jgi:hypothetical protein
MEGINYKNIKPIEGFRVMEWVRSVREKLYELYVNDPEEYSKQLDEAANDMKARFGDES